MLVPVAGQSDEELMSAWVESRARGTPHVPAFEALYARWASRTFGRIRAVLGASAPAHADEVHQETWSEVVTASAWSPGSFRGWIMTLAWRKALDRKARHDVAQAHLQREDAARDRFLDAPAMGPAPDDVSHHRAVLGATLEVVQGLPSEMRDAWLLRYVESQTFEEVAAVLQVPVGTAKTRVRRSNERIAAELARRGISPSLEEP